MNRSLEFRFYYFTPHYDETVRFYRDILQLAIFREWERGADNRGTIFRSPNGSGLIEIEAGDAAPNIVGGFYIEVSDIGTRYEMIRRSGIPLHKELGRTSYGHRNFKILDPNGVEISFFEYVVDD